jgi:prepilin-type N-terminal cleavage/methylation domain-containing protein
MDSVYLRLSKRRRRGQGGFTLIELLVVIAVLAILAGIVIFNVTGVANRGKSSACATDKQTVQTAVDAYFNDKGSYPIVAGNADTATLVTDNYIHTAPPETFAVSSTTGTVSGGGC